MNLRAPIKETEPGSPLPDSRQPDQLSEAGPPDSDPRPEALTDEADEVRPNGRQRDELPAQGPPDSDPRPEALNDEF